MNLPDSKYWLLSAGVTHGPVVLDPRGGGVEDAEVEGPAAPVVGGRPVVPDDDHLLRALEVPDGAHVTLAPVLLAPLPVGAPDHPHPHALHQQAGVAGTSPAPRSRPDSVTLHHSRHHWS